MSLTRGWSSTTRCSPGGRTRTSGWTSGHRTEPRMSTAYVLPSYSGRLVFDCFKMLKCVRSIRNWNVYIRKEAILSCKFSPKAVMSKPGYGYALLLRHWKEYDELFQLYRLKRKIPCDKLSTMQFGLYGDIFHVYHRTFFFCSNSFISTQLVNLTSRLIIFIAAWWNLELSMP